MTTTRTAPIIAAGIAGPVAAMALRKAGIQPTVYEAHPSSAAGIGTFLTIASLASARSPARSGAKVPHRWAGWHCQRDHSGIAIGTKRVRSLQRF